MGLSPKANLTRFFKNDAIKPLERKSLYKTVKRPQRKNWALFTAKNCAIEENLPKYQQFRNYNFQNFPEKDKEKYYKTFIATDHIAIHANTPKPQKNKTKISFLDLKGKLDTIMSNKNPYIPKAHDLCCGNFSSVNYNIITNEKNIEDL